MTLQFDIETLLRAHMHRVRAEIASRGTLPNLEVNVLRSLDAVPAGRDQGRGPAPIVAVVVPAILVLMVIVGALSELGPVSRHAVAGHTVVAAEIHLPTVTRLSQAGAEARATRWLAAWHPGVTGYKLVTAYHADALTRVLDPAGYVTYSSTLAENAYVLWFVAPPQGGWGHVTALVIVDGVTGNISAAQLRETN